MRIDRILSGCRLGLVLVALTALSTLPAGCGAPKTSDRDILYVGASDGQDLVGTRRNLLGQTSTGVWVDVRTAEQFNEEHIPGAINLPFQNVSDDHEKLKPYSTLVVYGDIRNDVKSQAMAKRLIELGYDNVHTLRGGIKAWKDAGYDVESAPESAPE